MALFQKHEPDLRELAAYVIEAARSRHGSVNRARVVKLLYLVDVERVRSRRAPLTGVAWTCSDFGPSAPELAQTLSDVERVELKPETWGVRVNADRFGEPGRGDDWVSGTKLLVDGVVRDCGGLDLNALLDHVYFATGPMVDARPGQPLDLDRAREDRGTRPARPLAPAPAPSDIGIRLERWRTTNRERLAPLTLDRPDE
ncbi:hypothetical protein VSS74_09860 [Conexibacter stalactiti]|uniref:Antitoxin SocA-like Panacea domain-containing protein n=1 Tax=Conexibacter stalactiti TaxID=1940611 RepID=A0ABU4HN05_9ACTN|nr:hypothetical protein [Conexibacter stalactiti]MDW5594642.1 hypothetical protein [Conexibacter stalactiti]MEC5035284.1 hypothetical protein [Conexibacter stalactiti]